MNPALCAFVTFRGFRYNLCLDWKESIYGWTVVLWKWSAGGKGLRPSVIWTSMQWMPEWFVCVCVYFMIGKTCHGCLHNFPPHNVAQSVQQFMQHAAAAAVWAPLDAVAVSSAAAFLCLCVKRFSICQTKQNKKKMFKANNGIPRQVKHLLILLLKQKQTKLVSHRCLSELPPLRLLQCNSVHLISYLGPSVMFIRFCFCFCCSLIFFFLTRPPVPRLFLVTTARRHASLGAL